MRAVTRSSQDNTRIKEIWRNYLRTYVGKYIRELGIKAQWIKPWTITTKDSDLSQELHNILDQQFNPERPNAVWC